MRTRLPKQIYLLMGAALLLGLLLTQVNQQTPRVNEALEDATLIAGIPSIPNLSGWPNELLAALKRVHAAFNDPESRVEALAELGEIYFANGFYGEAVQCFSALVKISPEEARWPYFLGMATRDYQDKRVAIDSFERALTLDDTYVNTRYELGLALVESGHIIESVLHFETLTEIPEWESWGRFGLAKGLLMEERYEEADQQLVQAIKLDSHVREFHALREDLLVYSGDFQGAALARTLRDEIPYEKKPYDPWIQATWEYCYDTFRLVRLAEAEALEGNLEAGRRALSKAESISEPSGSRAGEIESVENLLRSIR